MTAPNWSVYLPTWGEAQNALNNGAADPLDVFVYTHQPGPPGDERWRKELANAIQYAFLNPAKVVR